VSERWYKGELGFVRDRLTETIVAKIVRHKESAYLIAAANRADELARRVEDLEAIVAKLPKTADGVPIVPGMTVWEARGRDVYRMKNFRATLPDAEGFSESNWEKGWSSVCRLDRIFSTEAAALAAKGVK